MKYSKLARRIWSSGVSQATMRRSLLMARQAVERRIPWELEAQSDSRWSRSASFQGSSTSSFKNSRTGKDSLSTISSQSKCSSWRSMEMNCTTYSIKESLTRSLVRIQSSYQFAKRKMARSKSRIWKANLSTTRITVSSFSTRVYLREWQVRHLWMKNLQGLMRFSQSPLNRKSSRSFITPNKK